MATETQEMTMPTKVRLVATSEKYRKAPIFLAPFFDDSRKEFSIGKEKYKAVRNQEDRELWEFTTPEGVYLNNYEVFEISDKRVLDLKDPLDAMVYNIILTSGANFVAKSKKAINTKYHRLYIENREAEASAEIDEFEDIFTAASKIKSMKEDELRDLARVLKIHERGVSENVVKSNLLRLVKQTPSKVIAILNSSTYKTESIRVLLLDGAVISKSAKGYFTAPNAALGIKSEFIAFTDGDLSAFLTDKKNAKLVEEWLKEAKSNIQKGNDV